MMRYILERCEHRILTEEQVDVTPALIAKLRKDFLVLVGNVPRVDTVEKLTTFRLGVKTFSDLLERIMITAKEYLGDVAQLAELKSDNALASDARYLADNMSDAWKLHTALIVPGPSLESLIRDAAGNSYHLGMAKERYLYRFTSEAKKWDVAARRVAPKAWKWFESAATVIAKGASYGGRGVLKVDRGTGTLREMAGFKVRLDGFSGSDFEADGVQKFERGLQLFRQLANARFPMLLRNTTPFVLVFSGDPSGGKNAAGWTAQAIFVSSAGMHKDAKGVAHLMAHELGHGIYQNYLSDEAQNAWFSFIRGNTEPIDLRQVLKDIGEDGWIHEPNVYKSDPIRWLQVRGLGQDKRYRFERGEDIRRWIEGGGDPVVQVTRRQVTSYANTNPKEAFCEAFGMLIAYGPRTVLPEVRQMLGMLLPQLRTEGVEFSELLLLLESKVGGDPCRRSHRIA
jgi:hypothetical protein